MHTVNVHEAKSRLSQLLALVESGQEVLIARTGKPVARLSPLQPKAKQRRLGLLGNTVQVPDDWYAPLPDAVLASFQGQSAGSP
ncbi:MAG: type II toxin-antitoxin system prevent-host-death family antitoxin [Pseudomonadota bacterium]|nr:type II toxin-antitoxin system prevent-host-death family antitoxin [Pseudomonadota bacterium]